MTILKKYADRNYYDSTYDDFVGRLERGQIGVAMLRSWDLYGSECIDCEEKVTAFKYRGQRYDLHHNGGRWIIHQCRPPVEPVYPDDPNVRDGDGNIVSSFDWDLPPVQIDDDGNRYE